MTRSMRWRVLLAGIVTAAAVLTLAPAEASAQRRAVRRDSGRVVYVRPVYYSRPYYNYGGWYNGWYGGWYNWYGWPGYYGPYYRYPYAYSYYRDRLSEARLQVQPREAEVFIDGYFVGTVDDFDGWAQRLRVEPGEHELQIFLPGHRTYRQPVLFRPGASINIKHVMQPLASGDPGESRPVPAPGSTGPTSRRAPSGSVQAYPPRRDDPERPPRGDEPPPQRGDESREYGAIAIRVQPVDAEVIVDGERWDSPQAGDLTLQLSEGTHRVDVRKSGFRSYSTEIRVRRGQTTTLNVSLSRD